MTGRADCKNENLCNRNCVVRKSRINVPSIGLSPGTRRLLESNDRIMSDYGVRKRRSKLLDWG